MKATCLLPVALQEFRVALLKKVPGKSAFSKNSIFLVTLVTSKHSVSYRLKVRYYETIEQ